MLRDTLLVLACLLLLGLVCWVVFDVLGIEVSGPRKEKPPPAVGTEEGPPTRHPPRGPDEVKEEDVRGPQVTLFADKAAYAEWYREAVNEPGVDLRPPESIDFTVHKVVAIVWGDKPGQGHELAVKGVAPGELETVVTVLTKAPGEDAAPVVVYPGVTAAVPRDKRVRVVITGQRMRPVPKFRDFEPVRGADLDVDVRR